MEMIPPQDGHQGRRHSGGSSHIDGLPDGWSIWDGVVTVIGQGAEPEGACEGKCKSEEDRAPGGSWIEMPILVHSALPSPQDMWGAPVIAPLPVPRAGRAEKPSPQDRALQSPAAVPRGFQKPPRQFTRACSQLISR